MMQRRRKKRKKLRGERGGRQRGEAPGVGGTEAH